MLLSLFRPDFFLSNSRVPAVAAAVVAKVATAIMAAVVTVGVHDIVVDTAAVVLPEDAIIKKINMLCFN